MAKPIRITRCTKSELTIRAPASRGGRSRRWCSLGSIISGMVRSTESNRLIHRISTGSRGKRMAKSGTNGDRSTAPITSRAWPPLVGEVIAGEGVDASLLGAVTRDDGTQQATYNGWPLYYFAGDAVAGETNGQGINDVWYVLSADGDGIGIAAMAQALAVSGSALGDVLVDGEGRTLYLFVPDAQGASTCYDGCAAAWPPMVEEVVAGDGVDESLLGSVARDDGTEQVTYNGWPLYYFASDANPGEVNGQGVNDAWFVLSASGDAISS